MSSIEQKRTYLSGFDSLYTEVTDQPLAITGEIPSWLSGVLLRNGPGVYDSEKHTASGRPTVLKHWFDGLSMLHRFEVSDSGVTYTNRLLDSSNKRPVLEKGKVDYREFATDPCQSLFRRFFTFSAPKSGPTPNAAVNISIIDGHAAALTETPLPVRFDPTTLETVGVIRPDDDLTGIITTAHPHVRTGGSGDLINYLLHFSRSSTYTIYRWAPNTTTRVEVGKISTDMPSYMHSFALTENYAVLVEFPLVVNPLSFLLRRKTFIENYSWKPERGTRIRILNLNDGTAKTLKLDEPFFAFHHINAYEDGDMLHVDLCGYEDATVVDSLYVSRLRESDYVPVSTLRRLDIDLAADTVTHRRIGDAAIELPRIDSSRAQLPYRYAYGSSTINADGSDFLNAIVKIDVTTGEAIHWHQPGGYPGEPVFVARPDRSTGSDGEDDGVLLTVVLDGASGVSFLCVLDAKTLTEVARAEAPHTIPFGFHGGFVRAGTGRL